jgi:hypothetical protein
MQNPFRRLLLSAAALAALQTAAAQPDVLRNDDLSSMSNWFNSSADIKVNNVWVPNGMELANGGLSITAGRHALTYFTPAGSQQSLAKNESLQVTFDLSFSKVGTTSGGFRVGLFDSNGATRPTANGVSTGFKGYDGYAFTFTPNPGSDTNSLNLRKRLTTGSDQLLSTLSSTNPVVTTYSAYNSSNSTSSGSASGQVFQTGTVYAATYSISRGSGNALTIDFNVTGGGGGWSFGKSYSITGPSDLAFDAFAILSVSTNPNASTPTDGSNFSIDNLRVVYTPAPPAPPSSNDQTVGGLALGGTAIPEPSTYAACAGAVVLGLAFWRRRRAAAQGGSS